MTKDQFKDTEAFYKKQIEAYKKSLKTTEENYAKDVKVIKVRVDEVSKDLADKIKEGVRMTAQIDGIKVELDTLNTDKASLTSKNAVLDAQLGLKEKAYQDKVANLKKDNEELENKRKDLLRITADKHAELDAKKSGIEYAEGKNKGVLVATVAEKQGIQAMVDRHNEEKLDFAEKQHQHALSVAKHNEKMQKDNAIITKLTSWEKGLVNKDRTLVVRAETLDKRDKAASATEQAQKDKQVEQELRDIELEKKERRINNLIRMNKLKDE